MPLDISPLAYYATFLCCFSLAYAPRCRFDAALRRCCFAYYGQAIRFDYFSVADIGHATLSFRLLIFTMLIRISRCLLLYY